MSKVRIYELARELGVSSQQVVEVLQSWGEFARSASTRLEAPVARRLRAEFAERASQVSDTASQENAGPEADGVSGSPDSERREHVPDPRGEEDLGVDDLPIPNPVGLTAASTDTRSSDSSAAAVHMLNFDLEGRFEMQPEPPRIGGGSVVLKAIDRQTGATVAIKLVEYQSDTMSQRLFKREMGSLTRLKHPNIVKPIMTGFEVDTGKRFFVLDWYERSLLDVLQDGVVFGWEELLNNIAIPLSSALAHAHLQGVEHRDIKPANILIRADGAPVLADFGIAKLREEPATEATVANLNSGIYSPPDLADSTPWVRDVYSLGVVLLRCMSGTPIVDYSLLPETVDAVLAPPDFRRLLARAVDLDGRARQENGSVLHAELTKIATKARVKGQARDSYAWLALTNTAKEMLSSFDDQEPRRSPELIAQEDLSGAVFITYATNPETGQPNPDRLELIGERFRFTLVLDGGQDNFLVVRVGAPHLEDLERRRSRSLNLGSSFAWACQRPQDRDKALQTRAALLDRLQRWHDAQRDQRADQDFESSSDQLLSQWSALLDAREDFERRQHEPMKYTLDTQTGRDATVVLSSEPEEDLVGSFLDIVTQDSKVFGTGEVIDQVGDRLTMRSSRNFRALPRSGRLEPSTFASRIALQRQRDAILAAREGTAVRPDLAELLADPLRTHAPAPVPFVEFHADLDDDKREAVRLARGAEDFLVVQGPPGTGKTAFIAELVWQTLNERPEFRVLLVSQTHVAVDNALHRLDRAGVPGLVRLGRAEDANIAATSAHLTLDRQMTDWATGLRKHARSYLDRAAQRISVDRSHLEAALLLEELVSLLRTKESIERQVLATQDAPKTGLATALGEEDDPAELQRRLDRSAERQIEITAEVTRLLDGHLTVDEKFSVDDVRAAIALLVGESNDAQHLLRLLEIQADWLQRVANHPDMAAAFIKTRKVVAGTNLGFLGLRAVRDLDFDLCILDEASKATATETLVPLTRSTRWVLVGDTRQLPPMDEEILYDRALMEEHGLTEKVVKETLFQRLVDGLPPESQRMLRLQYRMIRPIGDMISSVFYEGHLRSVHDQGIDGYANLGLPVLWMDTAGLGNRRYEDASRSGDRGVLNLAEARLVIQRLRQIDQAIDKGFVKWPRLEKPHVLLIAPYRQQVAEITRLLSAAPLVCTTAEVLSVDAVQGREADFAVFSVTRSNPQGVIGFLGQAHWRRINVAMSRARYGLTIIGDASFASAHPGGLRDVLEYIREHDDDCQILRAAL
jgi:serine/threonine protein kinase/predicted ATPase